MPFIDGLVVAVPSDGKSAYLDFATKVWAFLRANGALSHTENWGVDVPHGKVTDFHRAVQAQDGETVVFSWVVWPDKTTRDTAMEKMMTPEAGDSLGQMPFDGKRMIFGGFETIFRSEDLT